MIKGTIYIYIYILANTVTNITGKSIWESLGTAWEGTGDDKSRFWKWCRVACGWEGRRKAISMNGGTFGRSHSEVPSCSTRCQEVGRGWTGWHTNEFPQESDPASRATVSLSGRSRGGRRPLAVPSVNIKTPSSSPSPLLMRVVGADLHDNKRGSPRKDEASHLACSLIHWLVH